MCAVTHLEWDWKQLANHYRNAQNVNPFKLRNALLNHSSVRISAQALRFVGRD